ncbi:MAG TPA: DNA polymerase III subunit alpha [Methylomirabilota bacterium]|jgi:error-prone DNA polymerase|nr:DNA polymerase III subunit alpha [Methylomirabilota bacterium]
MFVELHAQSAFTFLEGAEQPEVLVAEAARRGMGALALVDRDGVYGAPRFHRAAVNAGIRPIVGSELTLAGGARLPVLVEDREGWQNLCRLITRAKLGAPKGKAAVTLDDLAAAAEGLVCLTGGARGPLAERVRAGDREAARRVLDRLVGVFGRGNVFVEVQRHFDRAQERDLERLVALARGARVPILATNQPLHARPGGRAVADVFTCIREKTDLDHAGRRLFANAERGLRDAAAMTAAFRDLPEAVAAGGELALRLHFTLKDLGYRFPDFPLPPGSSVQAHLRDLVARGVRTRYGTRGPLAERARKQVAHELEIIGRLELAGYFLIVWDIVQFCGANDILVQGRGSAANSAVCYALGITAVDPVKMDLLFERFLSESRGEWPDIDLDLPSGARRESVIQYVYRRYGRLGAGMTANVITYRGRSAAREVGKALGLPADMQDRLARLVENWGYRDPEAVLTKHLAEAGCDTRHPRIRKFAALWTRLQDLPRHLGQHSGGMVIAAGRLDDVVPLEPATMPGRVVVQWDKDDCAALGIVKVDLLGLRMMSALQEAIALVSETGGAVDLAHLPPDDAAVYEMLRRADTIGVFQVESRAQMATLPRIRPERFYDLVVQVAIIRPGPIVGEMVHPYVNRRRGREPVTYPHPSLEPILARTLGVPLFQEQLLRIAMVAAGFTGSEAEELRRAFGFKRSERRMAEVEVKLREGMARQGITGEAAETIVHAITSFALYGFPECVTGDTVVIEPETGQRVRIEDVVSGRAELAATFACDDALTLRRRRVLGATPSGRRLVHRLQTAGNRELVATAEHPVLTPRGWRALGALAIGDRVAGAPRGVPLDAAPVEWDEVIGLVPAGMRQTYDLEIEEDHNFLANDLVVHNSHASSFALLAYASAYLKAHHGPAFYAALLNNQPMGFYHSSTVVNDARRHGVRVLPVDVTRSAFLCTLEPSPGAWVVRLGLRFVKGLRERAGRALVAARAARPFASARDLAARAELTREEMATLASIGALAPMGGTRRANLWVVAEQELGPLFAQSEEKGPSGPSPLPEMTTDERLLADYAGTGLTLGAHPMALRREELRARGVTRAADLARGRNGARVRVAGSVIVRQRPGTAKGFVFLSLEDETGIANVIVTPGLFARQRLALVSEPFLLVEGILQMQDGVISVRAARVEPLPRSAHTVPSHDFG